MHDMKSKIDEVRKAHPELKHMPDEKIAAGVESFDELVKVINDCMDQINLALENAIKVAHNVKADPVVSSAMLSEKLLFRAVDFKCAMHKIAIKPYQEELKENFLNKQKKSNGFFT